MEIEKIKIRNIYYLGTISVIIFLTIILNFVFITSYNKESKLKLKQLSDGIFNSKKMYLKEAIDRTINEIESEYINVTREEKRSIDRIEKLIEHFIIHEEKSETLYKELFSIIKIDFKYEIIILDLSNNELWIINNYGSNVIEKFSENKFQNLMEKYKVKKITSLKSRKMILGIGISEDVLNSVVIKRMKNKIRNFKLIDNGYIWINQITKYDGGDDYAIRVVHPNLPKTEGMKLSTKMEDIKGNKPYLEELEGIKKKGEISYEYYFKKMNSEKIAHKLSFAKLYKKYDWIIATGIYLDDLDELIALESERMNKTNISVIKKTFIIAFICLIACLIVIIGFEKRIDKLILKFQRLVSEQNKKLLEDKILLEEVAFVDQLTKCYNRRSMIQRLEEEISKLKRSGSRFCIAICDIDFFKRVNDTYGHLAGDEVLKKISEIFKENLRKEDIVARWGGEEFLFFLNISDPQLSMKKLENLREKIEKTIFNYEGQEIQCTISIGITVSDINVGSYNDLIKHSDEALYQAKEEGRNRTILYNKNAPKYFSKCTIN